MDSDILLTLVGQTRMVRPWHTLPKALAMFQTVTDAELRRGLVTLFLALISDQEPLTMAEQLLKDDGLTWDAPLLAQIHKERLGQ